MKEPGFKEIEHPSDIGIKFSGKSIKELFENAGLGMFSILTDISKVRAVRKMKIRLSMESSNPEDLLMIWLEKLLYCFEVDGMVLSKFSIEKIFTGKGKITLNAEVSGEKIDDKRHGIINIIKAPTYHLLHIGEDKEKHLWEGKVIFDV